MIGARKRDDDVTWGLQRMHDWDVFRHDKPRRHHGNQLMHQIRVFFKAVGGTVVEQQFESAGPLCGDAVPCLGCPSVVVVDRVEKVVFCVPAKRGKEHAKVEPGLCEALEGDTQLWGWGGCTRVSNGLRRLASRGD